MFTFECVKSYSHKSNVADGLPRSYAAGDDGAPLSVSQAEAEMVRRVRQFMTANPTFDFNAAARHLARNDPDFASLMNTYNGRQVSRAYGARPAALDGDDGGLDISAELHEMALLDSAEHNYSYQEGIAHVLERNPRLRAAYANFTSTRG